MTLAELVAKQKAFRSRERWITAILLSTLFGGTLSTVFARPLDRRPYLIGLFGVLALELLVLGLCWWRSLSRYGLRCSTCGRALTGIPGQVAVASGRCGNCGTTVWKG